MREDGQIAAADGKDDSDAVFRQERDAIAFLGVLTYMAFAFDPPVATGPNVNDITHRDGLNICAVIIDNADGEPIALAHNLIHQSENPLQHAEQLSSRAADDVLRVKRPRPYSMTVEEYYRSHLFYEAGPTPADFLTKGATLYTSLEPCPMCAATLCVARMKRIVYIVPDLTYGGAFDGRGMPPGAGIKDRFYAKYDLSYEALAVGGSDRPGAITLAARLYDAIFAKIGKDKTTPGTLRARGLYDTLFFDFLKPELDELASAFSRLTPNDLVTTGKARDVNAATLTKLQTMAKAPSASPEHVNLDSH